MTHLQAMRAAEMEAVHNLFRPGAQVLEVGGGDGFQARLISELGCHVTSIDVSPPGPDAHFPVQLYDGVRIPFADRSFDHVFSSNVLEHVRDIAPLHAEIQRVLKEKGTAIHVLPSTAWRAWTNIAHYAYIVKYLLTGRHSIPTHGTVPSVGQAMRKRGFSAMVRKAIFPGPHGEYASSVVELLAFRRRSWRTLFERDGFRVVRDAPCRVFYTGYGILSGLSVDSRRRLSTLLGSATNFFVLEVSEKVHLPGFQPGSPATALPM